MELTVSDGGLMVSNVPSMMVYFDTIRWRDSIVEDSEWPHDHLHYYFILWHDSLVEDNEWPHDHLHYYFIALKGHLMSLNFIAVLVLKEVKIFLILT